MSDVSQQQANPTTDWLWLGVYLFAGPVVVALAGIGGHFGERLAGAVGYWRCAAPSAGGGLDKGGIFPSAFAVANLGLTGQPVEGMQTFPESGSAKAGGERKRVRCFMRPDRLVRCLLCPVLLLVAIPGCQALHRYRPVSVLVRDAETKKPIPGANVHLSYPGAQDGLAPSDSLGTTEADGIVRLRAAPYGQACVLIDVTAKGYLSEQLNVLARDIEAIEPAPLFFADKPRPVSFVIEAFAGPTPTVELIVPTGYRGMVKAEVHLIANAQCPPGQRCFRYEVSPLGVAQVTGPPLLQRLIAEDYQARYQDGTVLPRHPVETAVGLRWVKCKDDDQYFFVGTEGEWMLVSRAERLEQAASQSSSRGGSGGRGRGSRRGGSQPPSQ